MDFRRGGNMPPSQQVHQPHPVQQTSGRHKHIDWAARTVRFELFTVIVGSALLLAAISLYLAFGTTVKSEANRVDTSKYQAVFLNGGVTSGSVSYSTYFGHITKLTNNYMVLDNVYYLTDQSTSSSSSSSPQLVKLGCQQLHSPYDEMVINRSQVAFWENLQTSGKVVQAIQSYVKQNPNGPNCTQSTSTSSTTPSTSSTTPQSTSTTPSTVTGH
jgi:hypothetical protein